MADRHATRHSHLRRRTLRWAFATAAMATLILTAASPAAAATITSPGSPVAVVDGDQVNVVGTGTAGNFVAVAECNFTAGGFNASDCNLGTAQFPIQIDASGNWQADITVDETFTDGSFSGIPPQQATTDCTVDLCQIQVSEYTSWPPAGAPVDFDSVDLQF